MYITLYAILLTVFLRRKGCCVLAASREPERRRASIVPTAPASNDFLATLTRTSSIRQKDTVVEYRYVIESDSSAPKLSQNRSPGAPKRTPIGYRLRCARQFPTQHDITSQFKNCLEWTAYIEESVPEAPDSGGRYVDESGGTVSRRKHSIMAYRRDVMAYTRVLFHNQVQTIQLPEMEDVDRPLLLAYLLYGIGLFKESKQEQAQLSLPVPDQSTNPESGEFWYYKALRTVSRTRPLDMAQVIMPNLMTHILESKIAGLLQSVDYLVNVARAAPSVSLNTAELSLLEKCLSNLNILMKEVPEVMKQLAPASLLALRGMVKRIEPVQDSKEDEETKLLRERVIRSMDTIWDHWNKTHVSATSHSRLMRKQAVWSRQTGDWQVASI
ncbi:hypothetical protein FRC17_002401 [Serendipita sp. 399]|nr:hypothetical protein FRC17_002401 [Serendipita sp. 399]